MKKYPVLSVAKRRARKAANRKLNTWMPAFAAHTKKQRGLFSL